MLKRHRRFCKDNIRIDTGMRLCRLAWADMFPVFKHQNGFWLRFVLAIFSARLKRSGRDTDCSHLYRVSRGNVPDFGTMFLKLKYTDITKNTYIRSSTVTEILAREKCDLLAVSRAVPGSRDVLLVHCACPSLSTTCSSTFTLRLHM